MRILLVNPPFYSGARLVGMSWASTLSHAFAPPMGLMYLKGFIRRESDFEIRIWNGQVPRPPGWDNLAELLKQYQPEIVGISVMFLNWHDALRVAQLARKNAPAAHIVLGGPHVTIYPEEALAHPEIDSVAIGEGEYTLLELARRIEGGQSLGGLKGVWYKQKGAIIRNPDRELEKNLDKLAFPDRSDFDPMQHTLIVHRLTPTAMIFTSRSCPFRCTFCYELNKHYRERSPENVIKEIAAVKDMGYRSVDFYDDVFNIRKQRVLALCDALQQSKINMPWSCRCRVDVMDEEMAVKMAESGCMRVTFGIESADARILTQIRKNTTPEQAVNAVNCCKKHGIETFALYMFGFPGETLEQARNTVRFAYQRDTDYAQFNVFMPWPGSELYQQAVSDPGFGGDYLREHTRNPAENLEIKIWETAAPPKKLLRLQSRAYWGYYLRPSYLLKSFLKLTSFEDFTTKVRIVLGLGLKTVVRSWS